MRLNLTDQEEVKCSFCGKSSAEVERILAGPGIAICDECIICSAEIAGEGRPGWCDDLIAKLTEICGKVA